MISIKERLSRLMLLCSTMLLLFANAHAEDSLYLGAYGLDPELWNETNINMLEEAGLNLLLDVPSDDNLLNLCQEHGIQVITTADFPVWWGGDGSTAGQYKYSVSTQDIAEIALQMHCHDAVLGDYLIDEPNCADYSHISEVFSTYEKYLPSRMPFINLHPYYDDELSTAMLGATYEQYLQAYADTIPVGYISFDSYPYSNMEVYGSTFLLGYVAVADCCRNNSLNMWATVQAGGWTANDVLDEYQIRLQTSVALTCGAKGIIYASWSADWWDESTTCVSKSGERNPTADYVTQINSEILNLENIYLEYHNICVFPLGQLCSADEFLQPQLLALQSESMGKSEGFIQGLDTDGALLCGCFENADGQKAIMLTNVNSMQDSTAIASVYLGSETTVWINGTLMQDVSEFSLNPGDSAFVITDSAEVQEREIARKSRFIGRGLRAFARYAVTLLCFRIRPPCSPKQTL